MRNFLFGLLFGAVVATGAGVWAQAGPVVPIAPGQSGYVLPLGESMTIWGNNTTGASGTIITTPGGMSFFNSSPGRNPC